MKKAALLLLLFVLAVSQLWLLEALVPYKWPHPMRHFLIARPLLVAPPQPPPGWRLLDLYRDPLAYALVVLLNLVNLWLIFVVGRIFRRLRWSTSRP